MSTYFLIDRPWKHMPSLEELCLKVIHSELPRELHFNLDNIEPPELVYKILKPLPAHHLRIILNYNKDEGVEIDQDVEDQLWAEHCLALDSSIDIKQRRELFRRYDVRKWSTLFFKIQQEQKRKLAAVGKKLDKQRMETERKKQSKRTMQIESESVVPSTSGRGKRKKSIKSSTASRRISARGHSRQQQQPQRSGSTLMQQLKNKALTKVSPSIRQMHKRSSNSPKKQASAQSRSQLVESRGGAIAPRPFASTSPSPYGGVTRGESLRALDASAATAKAEFQTRVIRRPLSVRETPGINFTKRKPVVDDEEEYPFANVATYSEREIFGKKHTQDRSAVMDGLRKKTTQETMLRNRNMQVARSEASRYGNNSPAGRARGSGGNGTGAKPRKRAVEMSSDMLNMRIPKKNKE